MKAAHNLVAQVLRQPKIAVSLGLAEWDLLIRQARHADLLARIYALLDEQGLIDSIPANSKKKGKIMPQEPNNCLRSPESEVPSTPPWLLSESKNSTPAAIWRIPLMMR